MTLLNETDYYENVDFDRIFAIDKDFFKFRQIRLLLKSNKFIKVKENVKNAEDLRKLLIRFKPHKAYYMVSRFLEHENIGSKLSRGIFIKQDRIVFDIDNSPKPIARKLIKWLKKNSYEIEYLLFSGQRGIHISVKRNLKCDVEDPKLREEWYKKQNELLVTKIKKSGINIDSCVCNSRQIVKIPMSLSNNVPCIFLDSVDNMPKVHSPVSSKKENNHTAMTRIASSKTRGRVNYPGLRSLPINDNPRYYRVSNNIPKTKGLYCLFLKFNTYNLDKVKSKLYRLLFNHKLTDCYIFKNNKGLIAICLKVMQYNKIKRILKGSKPLQNALIKYKQNKLWLDDIGSYIETVSGNNNYVVSRPHHNMLKTIGIPMNECNRMVGGDNPIYSFIF